MERLNQILARRLRAAMSVRSDMDTQTKLAEASGVSQSTVQRLLTAQTQCNLDTLESLAMALGLDPLELLRDEDSVPDQTRLDSAELQILALWRRVSIEDRAKVSSFMRIASGHIPDDDVRSGQGRERTLTTIPAPVRLQAAITRALAGPPTSPPGSAADVLPPRRPKRRNSPV